MSEAADDRDEPRAGAVGGHTKGHAAMAGRARLSDRRDFDEAARGLTVSLPDGGKVLDGGPI
jgi:hypothetical protein